MAVGLAIAGAGIVGGMWLSKEESNAAAEEVAVPRAPFTGAQTREVAPEDNPGGEASAAPAADVVTCWNGARAASMSECSEPTGPKGVSWVFPSQKTQTCEDRSASQAPQGERLVMVQCYDSSTTAPW